MVLNLHFHLLIMNIIKKKILFSNRLTGILFIVFAIAMAIGTFLDAGQETSPTPFNKKCHLQCMVV